MTQGNPQNTENGSPQSGPVWILWLIAGALVFGCAFSMGALFFLRQAGDLGWIRSLWPMAAQPTAAPTATQAIAAATPTQPPSPTVTPATATATLVPTSNPTSTTAPTKAATATPVLTVTPSPTHTPRPTQTTAPSATATNQVPPTPFVCDSLYTLANIPRLAPGQTFQCAIQEQELTDLANNYPESPCSETRFALDDGEIEVMCRMGIRMQATLAAQTKDCRVTVKVLKGTLGFKQVVQELIVSQFNVIRYDTICVDQLNVDDGQITVGGYGR